MGWLANRPTLRASLLSILAAVFVSLLILRPPALVTAMREWAIGIASQLRQPPASAEVVVVDIDQDAIAANGAWPWPREKLADLISQIADAGPKAVALDIVLSGKCDSGDPGNAALAKALAKARTSLGFVLPGIEPSPSPMVSIAVKPPVRLPRLWQSAGAELPCAELRAGAAGLGLVSLAGDSSASVTNVPALASIGETLYPGLAVDAVRLATGSGIMILDGSPDTVLSSSAFRAHLDQTGDVRLHASSPAEWVRRTVSAKEVLAGDGRRLQGKIVLVGSSLPQLGALRPTAADPLTPSTQIHADITAGLLRGSLPWRPTIAPLLEVLALALGAGVVLVAALWLRPTLSSAVTALAALGLGLAAIFTYHLAGLALDPLWPAIGVAATGMAAGLSQYSAARNAEAAIRRSFEQRLPPAVVAKLSKAGADLKIGGEERVITALFTDIEGFTAMTTAAAPRDLVRLLDGYFNGITRIVTEHGGMVDKIVGDAAHSFFNMPQELAGHECKALECADAILAFSETYRHTPDAARAGFGRTRIGIETGPAIVGDVGSGGKIDYSAHGPAVNLAARLQEANKVTGTSILAGPGMKAANPAGWSLESLGHHEMRGFGPVEVYSPRRDQRI